MSDELKDKIGDFVKYIISKKDNMEIEEVQKRFNDLMEYFNKFAILTVEDFEALDKEISDYDSIKEELKTYKAQKEIDSDKISSMKAELANNLELNEKYKKLNEEYNVLKQKYNVCYNDNTGFQMKIKNNEKLIKDLQEELNNSKKDNFEKFEKIRVGKRL